MLWKHGDWDQVGWGASMNKAEIGVGVLRMSESSASKVRFRNMGSAVLAGLLLLLPVAAVHASAHSEDGEGAVKAGAARAARLSAVDGQVQVIQDGQVIADQATTNLPLFEGSQIITGNEGRAEVMLEDGSLARISPNSTLTLSRLQREGSTARTTMVLNGGLAYFELQPSTSENSIRVSFDRTSFEPSGFSVVRVSEDVPPGQLAVFSGNVHVERGNTLQVDVHGGESLKLNAKDPDAYDVAETIEPDSWDSWNADRDQALNAASANQTAATSGSGINPALGLNELDANGNWYNVPGQGYIWSPYDAQMQGTGWDPYGFGRWVYYPRFGYVWVSGYNWGYAPFQCGTWNYFDTIGWGWSPGMGYGMGAGMGLGGCNPWWSNYGGGGYGGGGWGYNIGNVPRGYRPPRRPTPHPIRPGGGGGTLRLTRVAPVPVDKRNPNAPTGPVLRGTPHPVTIAGHVVEPLRPVAPRQTNEHAGASFGTTPVGRQPSPVVTGSHPVYSVGTPSPAGGTNNPGSVGRTATVPQPIYRPAAPNPGTGTVMPGGGRPSNAGLPPASRGSMPTGGGMPSRAPSGGASMPSRAPSMPSGGGGGGGGGAHPSGGGGSPHK